MEIDCGMICGMNQARGASQARLLQQGGWAPPCPIATRRAPSLYCTLVGMNMSTIPITSDASKAPRMETDIPGTMNWVA